MIGAPLAYGETAYQSGFKHGVNDARMTDTAQQYILQPGKGFQFHTWEFVKGYVNGFCSIAGPHSASDGDTAFFDCRYGPASASWITRG